MRSIGRNHSQPIDIQTMRSAQVPRRSWQRRVFDLPKQRSHVRLAQASSSRGLPSVLAALFLTLSPTIPSRAEEPKPARIRTASFAEDTCRVVEDEAKRHALPAAFFARLIWRESLFNPAAVSGKGAQGIAQFMPGTAAERGLADPFDPASSLAASAGYLRDLRKRFGSLGLAAAAYNSGPNRVATWLGGKSELPLETQNYVLWITGHPVENWSKPSPDLDLLPIADGLSFSAACRKLALRGLTAKLPSSSLRPSGWQKLFASGLGIKQVAASKPGRIRVVIDPSRFGAKDKPTGRKPRS